ncbi:hypothetical protein AB0M86_29545 [Streptomyces sp. NPDC051639]|uniref:hypothetical protein n=1 Tax=Streptomyces sp. NPDC051639 TaxID=3155671 RepID=UPI0034458E7B
MHVQARTGFDERLREQRQSAYANLLSACDAVYDALDPVMGSTIRPLPPEELAAAWRTVNQTLKVVQRAARTASVAGPADIAGQGLAVHAALHSLVDVWRNRELAAAADQRAIAHATAHQAWTDAVAAYMVLVQGVVQRYDRTAG